MLHIDGSYREGGGQIIRTALALSALTRIPFRAEKIRQNRPKPGLKHQHLCCIKALEKLSDARVKGAQPGSSAIEFVPGKTTPGTLWLDIGTAGSITLLLQSLLLPSMFADSKVQFKIKGGTDTKWSMPIDYLTHVILDHFKDFVSIKIEAQKRGYYPKGQGFLKLSIIPVFHITHLADNIIPLLALVGGKIKTDTITEHIHSNIYVCETFLGTRFKVDKKQNLIEAE